MKRGRKPKPWIKWSITVPLSIAARVDLLLQDPLTNTGRIRYAARSGLITQLLQEWLEKKVTTPPPDISSGDGSAENPTDPGPDIHKESISKESISKGDAGD